jgi:hypothetical protein
VYQGQKGHLFRPSLSFLAKAQPRLENRRGQKALLAEVHIIFFIINYKIKDTIGKITNLFRINLFQIDKFNSTYVLTIFYSICYQLANKTRNLLFAIPTITYLHNL